MVRFKLDDGKINAKSFFDIVNYLDKNLLVGVECERVLDSNPRETARYLKSNFVEYSQSHNESLNFTKYKNARSNEYNVAFVTTDSSFPSENEILYGGNIENFEWNYNRLWKLEKVLDTIGADYFHTKTSNHVTLLTAYNKRMDGIILKNIMNITRAYSSALLWLCSGDPTRIIRSNINQYAKPLNHINVNTRDIVQLKENTDKYTMFNFRKQKIIDMNGRNEIVGICIEFRSPDGIRVPSAIASIMQLYKAIIYKAVEFSVNGLVQIESLSSSWQTNKLITSRMCVGEYMVTEEHKQFMREESKKLIDSLSPYIKRFDDRVIKILRKIADKPISMRGSNIWKIDEELYQKPTSLSEKVDKIMLKIINQEVQAENMTDWKKKIANEFGCTVRNVEKMMKVISDQTQVDLKYEKELKTVVFL